MLDDYIKEQPIAYRIMRNTILKDRCSHAYLIEAKEYEKKNDLTLAFAKYLLCPLHHTSSENKDTSCPICRKEEENILDIKWIRPDGLWIKKFQMDNLQEDFGKKPIEGDKKIYVIEGADKLNDASANSILKFLEEPEDNVIALLIVDNIYQVLPTIVSRCQVIPLKNVRKYTQKETMDILLHLVDSEILSKDKIEAVLHFAAFLEKNGQATILYENNLWFQFFSSKEDMLWALDILLYLYKDAIQLKCERFIEIFIDYESEIKGISNQNSLVQLCDKIGIILEAKESVRMNLNMNLILDHMICKMKEVKK